MFDKDRLFVINNRRLKVAKEYNFSDYINLKELNIFYKYIIGVFKAEDSFGIIIDDKHVCFMPNVEETKKFIRAINLNIAILSIEKGDKDYVPKISFSNNLENEVVIYNKDKKYNCFITSIKDIRIAGNPMNSYKKCIKQLYSKVLKNGIISDALDFNFQNVNPLLINDMAVSLLGLHRLSSGEVASINNYKDKFYNLANVFFNYDTNKEEDLKGFKISNDFVEGVLQVEEAFYTIGTIKKNVVLYLPTNKIQNSIINFNAYKQLSLIKTDTNKNYLNCVLPKGTSLVLINQFVDSNEINNKTNNVIIKPSIFEIREQETSSKQDTVCRFIKNINIREDFKNAFLQNLEKYIRVNTNLEPLKYSYEAIRSKNETFFEENDQIELTDQVDSLIRLDKFNFLIEQINDLNYDREVFSENRIGKIKKSMFLALIFASLNNFSELNMELFISAFKYQYAKLNKKELETELERFEDIEKEKLEIIMSSYDKSKEEFESIIKGFKEEDRRELIQVKSYFNDVEILSTISEDADLSMINNKIAKQLVRLSLELDIVFDIMYEYILTENFAESRLQDILTHDQINTLEMDGRRNFALISIETTKNMLISKAMNFFEKFKNNKSDQQEESSAVAAKARLSKVMIGRQIAREQQEKQS